MNNKISLVIAAYNEAERISNVLKVVEKHPLIDEVIVINDGSQDNTSKVVKKFNVTLIENEKNIGKTLSVKKGIEQAKNNLIMLLDADLIGLDAKAINKLAEPVLNGQVDWTLSCRGNSMLVMKLTRIDWVSGERVIPRALLLDPLIWSRPDIGYGLEALMNKSLLGKKKTFRSVYMKKLKNTKKSQKTGYISGWAHDINMVRQIGKAIPLRDFFAQYFKMSYLNIKYSLRK